MPSIPVLLSKSPGMIGSLHLNGKKYPAFELGMIIRFEQ